ncbi:MAG: hypothetical protein GY854_29800 [Deltaproteobacteria bacterium]|nr:hypothetical protein [Deltaproteobacteria bacterium]
MSRQQFEPLPDNALVFRVGQTGKEFFPEGARFPNEKFFVPSSTDVKEGKKRGRRPGLSAWDRELTTPDQAKTLMFNPTPSKAKLAVFGLITGTIRNIGQQAGVELDVVADPLTTRHEPGADGHALIEGLKRPPGGDRLLYKGVRDDLVETCRTTVVPD